MAACKPIAALAVVVVVSGPGPTAPLPSAGAEPAAAADLEFFEREVRPILVRRCYECHGERKQEASLRLDTLDGVLHGSDSGPVVVPGSPDESRLVTAIGYRGDVRMPPDGKLPDDEIEVLAKWIQLGAPWPAEAADARGDIRPFDLVQRRAEHWAWRPVSDPSPPEVAAVDWPRDPLDRFILAKLEAAGVEPAAEADRRTWLRRVTFDLVGLPPAPEEIDAFLADDSPDAFERVVDRLLASPHFGERWARHWMDLVRYAETYGHEFDYSIPGAWRYRDYLVRAFNADVPYDEFVTEHIAGDLMSGPRRHPSEEFNESVIGTAFWWLGEATHAPTDVRGDEAGRIDNQIDVFSKTFLGLTIACARCHDHKFDAISTRDYYALAGFLQSSRRQLAPLDVNRRQERLAGEAAAVQVCGNRLLTRSTSDMPFADLQRRFARSLQAVMDPGAAPQSAEGPSKATWTRWRQALDGRALRSVSHPLFVLQQVVRANDPAAVEAAGARLRRAQAAWEEYDRQSQVFADFEGGSFGGWLPAGWAFGEAPVSAGQWDPASGGVAVATAGVADSRRVHRNLHGALRSPTFTLSHDTIHYRARGNGGQIRLVLDGYFMNRYSALLFEDFELEVKGGQSFAWHVQDGDLHRYRGHRAYIELEDAGDGYLAVDEIRFSDVREPPPPRASGLALTLAERLRSAPLDEVLQEHATLLADAVHRFRLGEISQEQAVLVGWLLDNRLFADDASRSCSPAAELKDLREQLKRLGYQVPSPATVVAMVDGTAEDERVHIRGNHRTLGDVVPRRLPEALGGERPRADESGSGRLLLAERIASPDNPLTARVMVNRMWHHLTRRGIVASVDNFGARGTPPTHPELLDHLATRLVRDGWSLKRLIRAIVLSSTYRMASTPTEAGRRLDPANELLHAMRVRRLEAEAIRDAILSVSGRLDRTLGGPSVPVHVTEFMIGRGRPESGPLDGRGRRSLYISINRNFLSPMMLAFDTPIPFTAIGRRNVSNVPAQALFLMNDPFVVGEARHWAERLLADAPRSVTDRVGRLYGQAFGRPPTAEELESAVRFLERQSAAYGVASNGSGGVQAWADLCHVLLNSKEFLLIF